MSGLIKFFIIFTIFLVEFSSSSYIKPDELTVDSIVTDIENSTEIPTTLKYPVVDEIETETSIENSSTQQLGSSAQSTNLSDDETQHIFTGELFEIRMTIKHEWSNDLLDRNSMKFKELAKIIDTELISFFDNELNIENSIPRENFMVVNMVPSSKDGYVYVTVIVEASEQVTGQTIFESLDLKFRLYDKIYDLEIVKDGFKFKGITNEYMKKFDQHVECDNEYCKPSSAQTQQNLLTSETSSESHESALQGECDPNEKFHRGSTSIYIFENNEKCVENVKKRSLQSNKLPKCSEAAENEKDNNSLNSGSDELLVSASENHEQTEKSVKANDDEVIVVVRKRGDKVFIEI